MQIGVIGLGRMGSNITRRLLRAGHQCVTHNRTIEKALALVPDGASVADSPQALVQALAPPRHIWLMLPAGPATREMIDVLSGLLDPEDALIDGGNGDWREDLPRAVNLGARGVHYLDVGVSGGVWGLERGYCLMVGGEPAVVARVAPVLASLAPEAGGVAPSGAARPGYVHAGPVGAGHYAKMVHNAIEYGMMQSLAEGLELLHATPAGDPGKPPIDAVGVAQAWRAGSVIQSWLLDLAADALVSDPELSGYTGRVDDSGEGRWAAEAALAEGVAVPALAAALFARFRSRSASTFADKALSAIRAGFGGHKEAAGA